MIGQRSKNATLNLDINPINASPQQYLSAGLDHNHWQDFDGADRIMKDLSAADTKGDPEVAQAMAVVAIAVDNATAGSHCAAAPTPS